MITYFNSRIDVNNPSFKSEADIVNLIKEDEEIANQVRAVRLAHRVYQNETDPEKQAEKKNLKDELKGNLPGFVVSGEFTSRNNKSCLQYHARIVIDIDHFEELEKLKQKVINDKTVIMVFISPSGDGLKIVHKLDEPVIEKNELIDFHKQAFQNLEKHYLKQYKVQIDKGGSDLSRLCFISSDPSIYFNSETEPYSFLYVKKNPVNDDRNKLRMPDLYYKRNGVFTGSREDEIEVLEDICKWQKENNICILCNYENWLKVLFAIKNIVGDNPMGEELFQKLSSTWEKYNSSEVSEKWNNKSNKLDDSKKVSTIGSILWLAEIYGYKCRIKGRLNGNISYNKKTAKLEACKIFLRFNTLSKRIQIKKNGLWINLEDRDLVNITISIFEEKNVTNVRNFLLDCSPEVNPAMEFLNQLPKWDKTDRFQQLSNTLRTNMIGENLKLIYLKKWFIGVVYGMLNSPGKDRYNENVIILLGDQGIGKTRWIKKFLPEKHEGFFAVKNINPGNKDDKILMCEKFIILMDESSQLLKIFSPDLKSLTSSSKFSERAPYGYVNQDYCRVASLIGSSNDMQILSDVTGNRRFWIIEIEEADYEHNIDMDQLWAQAKYLHDQNEPHWLVDDEIKWQVDSVEKFGKINSYEDLINIFLEPGTSDDEFMSASEILFYFKERLQDKMPQLYANLLGTYLRKWGFERKHKANRWGYYVYKKGPVSDEGCDNITATEVSQGELFKDAIVRTRKCPY